MLCLREYRAPLATTAETSKLECFVDRLKQLDFYQQNEILTAEKFHYLQKPASQRNCFYSTAWSQGNVYRTLPHRKIRYSNRTHAKRAIDLWLPLKRSA